MSPLRLVIFDLDGVLVDACEWHRAALNEALKEVCDYEIPLDEHYSTFNGTPTKVKLGILIEREILNAEDQSQVYDLKQQKTLDIISREGKLQPEKVELISWLKRRGLRVACFTNSIRETAHLMLKKTGVEELLDIIITNQDVAKPKPDPEGYNKILNYYKIEPESAIIIEDSPKGRAAAYAAGCKVLEVENPEQVTKETVKRFIDENFDSDGG